MTIMQLKYRKVKIYLNTQLELWAENKRQKLTNNYINQENKNDFFLFSV